MIANLKFHFISETLRSYELNDEHSKFKSYSLDPFPDCQTKKRNENFRKRNNTDDDDDTMEPVNKAIDCNGGISKSQRSDHMVPLLVNANRKRWHSLEMVRGSGADVDHEISGCEDLIDDNSKKSLGRNIIKSWLVGIFQSSTNGLKGSTRNGSGILLQQHHQPPSVATTDKETSIV
jgi:hypothetical protein